MADTEELQAAGPKYPDVMVRLSDIDGNAFVIISVCSGRARKAGVPSDEIKAFQAEATSGDYDHLLQTCMRWFDVS